MANNNHFNLTLDTTKPTGGIVCDIRYTNKVEKLALTYNADAAYMRVWFDEVQYPTAAPEGIEWQALAKELQTAFAEEATYYYHVQFVDSIGNESEIYSTDFITYDTTAPKIRYFNISDLDSGSETLTNAREIKYEFSIEDASVSGIKSVVFSGACATVTLENPGVGADLEGQLVLTDGDEAKKVTLTIEDYAGNKFSTEKSITLDMHLDAAIIQAYRNEKDAANLIATYSNTNVIFVELEGLDSGVAGYKIWHTAEAEPAQFNNDGKYSRTIEFNHTLADVTICAKVVDTAGNITESIDKVINIDTVQPTGTVSTDINQFSNVAGYNKVVITANVADNMPVALADKYIEVNGTKVANVTWNENKAIVEIDSTIATKEGANAIAVYAQDVAMKEANVAAIKVAECAVELDTKAPTAEFGTPNAWYVAQGDVKLAITHADGAGVGVEKLFVWVDTEATAAIVPTGVAATAALTSGTAYTPDYTSLAQGKNYIHALVVDKVGNSLMINSAEFGFDSVKPEKPAIVFDKNIYPSATASVTITASDATSGLNKMWVEGDITNPTSTEGEAFATTRSVTLKEGDGEKSIKVRVSDKAGNISEYSEIAKTVLDTTAPAATIALVKRGTTEALGNFSAVAEFDAQIAGVDDAGQEGKAQYYQVYGEGIGVAYSEDKFVELVYDEGKAYKTVQLTATANAADATSGEVKVVYVIVKDDAGHKSAPVSVQFTYDPSAAVIEVSNVSDNIISCVHAFRRTNVNTVNNKYCDEVTFSFTPDSNIIAYKVCAFASQAEAENAGLPENIQPIPMNNKSTNMYATNIVSNKEVNCLITGADLKERVGEDGAYIIVVYAQNEAGVWSEAAKF
jgi:hypothetical protein